MNKEEICEILRNLANGINPFTGEKCKDTDMLRDPEIVSTLYEIVLSLYTDVPKENVRLQKKNVVLKYDVNLLEKLVITEDLSIKPFSEKIAPLVGFTTTKIMDIIQNYLIFNNYLEKRIDETDNNRLKKFSTKLGEKVGILNSKTHSQNGLDYHKVLYTRAAQKFIISNFHLIAEWYNTAQQGN